MNFKFKHFEYNELKISLFELNSNYFEIKNSPFRSHLFSYHDYLLHWQVLQWPQTGNHSVFLMKIVYNKTVCWFISFALWEEKNSINKNFLMVQSSQPPIACYGQTRCVPLSNNNTFFSFIKYSYQKKNCTIIWKSNFETINN